MKNTYFKNLILILLALALTLSFAACDGDSSEEPDDSASGNINSTDVISRNSEDNKTIEMPYSSDYSFNPISGSSLYNLAVSNLMFEGLFDLDETLTPVPVLCESYTTEDGIKYTFNIRSGVPFHDGSILTANDVVYSINFARNNNKYSRRFDCIKEISASSGTAVDITLNYANYSFPALLDIKIVKSGTLGDRVPVGTGPYVYSDGPCLLPFSSYRDKTKVFTERIGLVNIDSVDFAESFENGDIDIVTVDPADNIYKYVKTDYDIYYYDTTILQYIGFNFRSFITSDPAVRTAISCLTDREYITKTIMNNTVRPSSLILNPRLCGYYDSSWETGNGFDQKKAAEILEAANIKDYNEDGLYDYPLDDNFRTISLKFIVNKDDGNKVAAARHISDKLNEFGIKTELKVLSWDDYLYALSSGDYSMYYAEVGIAPDYNFNPLLESGGALNYGGLSNSAYSELVYALLAAEDGESRLNAAEDLCRSVAENSPIVPVGYKKYAVMTHRKQLEGFSPNVSNIFFKSE